MNMSLDIIASHVACHDLRWAKSRDPNLEGCLDRPENRYGRYGFASFFQHVHIYRGGGWNWSFTLRIFSLAAALQP